MVGARIRPRSWWSLSWFDYVLYVLLAVVIVVTLYPLYYVAINSLSDSREVLRGTVTLFPRKLTIASYEVVLSDPHVLRSFLNTVLYTSVGTVINIVLTAMCAYPLSITTFVGRKQFSMLIVFTLLFNGGIIPRYIVVESLGMLDTMWAVILPAAVVTWYMFIMRTYFRGIPDSLRESAYIDGANDIQVLFRIVIPLSAPVIGALTVFYSVMHWNGFFNALIYLYSKSKYPLQIVLRNVTIEDNMAGMVDQFMDENEFTVAEQTIKYAVIMVSTIPILLIYPFMQKHFAKGVTIGAVKE